LANSSRTTLKLAVKPGREELWLSIKISLLGIGVVGLIGFVIKLLSYAIGGAAAPARLEGNSMDKKKSKCKIKIFVVKTTTGKNATLHD